MTINACTSLPSLSSQVCCHVPSAGSPLGLFLALRKVDPGKGHGLGTRAAATLMPGATTTQGQGDGLPAVRRLYNLYHPFDPVGYRSEAFELSCHFFHMSLLGRLSI